MTAAHEGSRTSGRRGLGYLNECGGPYSAVTGSTNAPFDRTKPWARAQTIEILPTTLRFVVSAED